MSKSDSPKVLWPNLVMAIINRDANEEMSALSCDLILRKVGLISQIFISSTTVVNDIIPNETNGLLVLSAR